jgi:hypothetical protein
MVLLGILPKGRSAEFKDGNLIKKLLNKQEIAESIKSIDRNGGLEKTAQFANAVISILDKIIINNT